MTSFFAGRSCTSETYLVLQDEATSEPEGSQSEDSPDSSRQGTPAEESDREVGRRWCCCTHTLQAAKGVQSSSLRVCCGPCITPVEGSDMMRQSLRAQQPCVGVDTPGQFSCHNKGGTKQSPMCPPRYAYQCQKKGNPTCVNVQAHVERASSKRATHISLAGLPPAGGPTHFTAAVMTHAACAVQQPHDWLCHMSHAAARGPSLTHMLQCLIRHCCSPFCTYLFT